MRFHRTPRLIAATAISLSLVAAACGGDDDADAPDGTEAPAAGGSDCGTTLDELVTAAKAEGKVNLQALPPTWANYEGILAKWDELYGIDYTVANPDASSADEMTAIETLRGQPDMPESFDVGPAWPPQLDAKGFLDPFKPSVWDEIPTALKDPDGKWVASYYGIMTVGVNTTLVDDVPTSFADLKDPKYANQVAINGDPREAGAAFAAVMAASLANGGSFDDIQPGIDYFAELADLGVFNPIDVEDTNLVSGEIPIAFDWNYNWPGKIGAIEEAGFEFTYSTPTDAAYSSYYAQGVVTESPHPCAVRLFIEHLLSDDGALGYLEGGAVPARAAAMLEAGVIPAELAATLPAADVLANPQFPTQEQIDAANAALTENWGPMVLGG